MTLEQYLLNGRSILRKLFSVELMKPGSELHFPDLIDRLRLRRSPLSGETRHGVEIKLSEEKPLGLSAIKPHASGSNLTNHIANIALESVIPDYGNSKGKSAAGFIIGWAKGVPVGAFVGAASPSAMKLSQCFC